MSIYTFMPKDLPKIFTLPNLPGKLLSSVIMTALAGCVDVSQLKNLPETASNPLSPKEKMEQIKKIDLSYFEKMAKVCHVDNGWNGQYEAIYQSVLKEFSGDENFNYFLNSLPNIEEKRNYIFSIGYLWTDTAFERETTFTKYGGIIVTYTLVDSGKNLPLSEKKELKEMLIKDVVISAQSACLKSRIDEVNQFTDSITFKASFDQNRAEKSLGQFVNPLNTPIENSN